MKYSIIEEIYYGNRGNGECVAQSEAYGKTQGKLGEAYKKLEKTLNEEQKAQLDEISGLEIELESEAAVAYYKEGLKTGILLGIESLQ